jgi:hypothetical protein
MEIWKNKELIIEGEVGPDLDGLVKGISSYLGLKNE